MDARLAILCLVALGCGVSVEAQNVCASWDSYTVAQFAAIAQYPNIIGENGRKCTITSGGRGTACNYYVKYDIDGNGSNNWLGLTFGGTPGGTGCCSSVSACNTLNGAASWLKSQYKDYCCGSPVGSSEFSCTNWNSYSVSQFAAFAAYPNIIGENGRKCTITSGGRGTACNHYVKYDIDGNGSNNWLGLTFGGTPGGTGCCSSVSACNTLNGAASWLKSQYKEYCCGSPVPEFSCANWDHYTAAQFAEFAEYPNIIGENGRKCTITSGGRGTACNHYVKYDIDGNGSNNWLGLTFGGTPGGTGCCGSVSGCSTLNGAGAWLKEKYRNYCCGPTVSSPLNPVRRPRPGLGGIQ